MDLSRLLTDDVLADALRRAAPRDLAVSRCVCRAWRALIDGRRLLRADLLPHTLAGVFINYCGLPYLFSPPSVDLAEYHHLPCTYVRDHCNGLLLTYSGVLNPATGGWTALPPPPRMAGGTERFTQSMYLAFEPTTEPSHYQVLAVPTVPLWCGQLSSGELKRSEWPPSPCDLSVFSSRTGRWEQRPFVRENEAAGTVADVASDGRFLARRAVCCRGALYVHCKMDFIMRISLSDDTYRVIKPPADLNASARYEETHLGKSQRGVYLAVLQGTDYHLRVWILDESPSPGQTNWILKHDSCRGLALPSLLCTQQANGPWVLADQDGDDQAVEWDSDQEDGESIIIQPYVRMGVLAFHPYREIVFLHRSWSRGLAYHFNSSKLEDLGNLCPKDDEADTDVRVPIGHTFPYTPCFMGHFSEKLSYLDDY